MTIIENDTVGALLGATDLQSPFDSVVGLGLVLIFMFGSIGFRESSPTSRW